MVASAPRKPAFRSFTISSNRSTKRPRQQRFSDYVAAFAVSIRRLRKNAVRLRGGQRHPKNQRQRRRDGTHVDLTDRMRRPARTKYKKRRFHFRLTRPVAMHALDVTGRDQTTRTIFAGHIPRP